jgi:hypothetical protein
MCKEVSEWPLSDTILLCTIYTVELYGRQGRLRFACGDAPKAVRQQRMDVEKGREMRSIIDLEITRYTVPIAKVIGNVKQPTAKKLVAPGQSCILILLYRVLSTV